MLTYLNLGRMGRFANGLFEIAGTIGIAVKNNQNFAFPKWINHDARDRFGSQEDVYLQKYFVNPLPEVPDIPFQNHGYFWGYRDIRLPNGNWNMEGHFQSDKYFNHCIDVVRSYFTMYDEQPINGCAVHMRFGDYDDAFHPRPSPIYYSKALEHIPIETPIYLFSDDLEKAYHLLESITDRPYTVEQGGYIEAFKKMKCCKHFICGNSSYSLMAAILADQPGKIVTAPAKWFGPAWPNPEEMARDIYPENCIVI